MKSVSNIVGVSLLCLSVAAQASTPYLVNWNNNPNTNGMIDPYPVGPGEQVPAGVTNSRLGINTIGTPSFYGIPASTWDIPGQVLDDRGAWTGNGYKFNESVAGGMTGTFTFEAVFYLVATNNYLGNAHYDRGLIWDNASANNNRGLNVSLGDDGSENFRVQYSIDALGGGGGGISLNSGYVIQTNQWYRLGVVHDSTGARIYLNDQLIANNLSGIGGRTVLGTNSQFYVASSKASYQMGGFLDAFALSNVALGPGSFALPEPTTTAFLAMGAALLLLRKNR